MDMHAAGNERKSCLFVSVPTRHHKHVRWATPVLFAVLWLAYLWASALAPAGKRAWLLDWGALTGGEAMAATWNPASL